MKEKILILTLGTGKVWDFKQEKEIAQLSQEEKNKIIKEKFEKKEFCYQSTIYRLDDIEMETAFVAEPLIKNFCPDHVFILGTIKSAWASFYSKFAKKDSSTTINSFIRLDQIEREYGQKTCGEELNCLEKEINRIYKEGIILDSDRPEIDITVLVTRYGLNQEELLDNYKRMSKAIGNELEGGKTYEIAFDITHSFRSLPLYNFVILNYFRHITQYDIAISHIYYGNLEARYEMNNKAYIVDLKDLIEVLDLTSGIDEFKNTGNAVTLLSLIPEGNLKKALRNFDWAMQINAFNVVEDAVREVLQATKKQDRENTDLKYADLKEMLQIAITEKFFHGVQEAINRIETEKEDVAEMQYMISKWYLEQNRYGQAIATAMEALRSYLVKMYVKCKNLEERDENYKNENNRKAAIARLKIIAKKSDRKDEMERKLCELEESRCNAKRIRDEFAHNLEERERKEVSHEDNLSSKEIVEQFISKLEILKNDLQKNEAVVYKAYTKEYNIESVKDKIKSDYIRLVVTANREKLNFRDYMRSNKQNYKVYRLPDEMVEFLEKGRKQKQTSVGNATLLWKYITTYFDEKVNVILSEVSLKQMIHFSMMLQDSEIKVYSDIMGQGLQVVPKMEYDIEYDFKKNCDKINSRMEQYLKMKPVLVG